MQDILLDAIFVLYYVQKNNNEGCVHVQKKCNTLLDAIFVLYYVQKNNNEGCVHVQKKCNTLLGEIRLPLTTYRIELIR